MDDRQLTTPIAKRNRWWLRYGLRTPFALMTIFAALLGGFIWWTSAPPSLPHIAITGPITSGGPPAALGQPTDGEVMKALENAWLVDGIPRSRTRNRQKIVKELIADYVDAPRDYGVIGLAQQHHAIYRYTIYYESDRDIGWSILQPTRDTERQDIFYVDHNHLHILDTTDK